MRRVTDRMPPRPPPFAGLQRPFRRRWKIVLILIVVALAASQVWIWTAKEPRAEPIAAVIDTQNQDPLRVRVRFLVGDELDRVPLSLASSQGSIRAYIAPEHADRTLDLPNVAVDGPVLGRPIELPSRGGLTARLELEAEAADQVFVAIRMEYGDGTSERLLLNGLPIVISYDDYLFGQATGTAIYTRYVAPPETRLLATLEGLGLVLVALFWLGARMFRDSGLVDKKRLDRRFYPIRWIRWWS